MNNSTWRKLQGLQVSQDVCSYFVVIFLWYFQAKSVALLFFFFLLLVNFPKFLDDEPVRFRTELIEGQHAIVNYEKITWSIYS